ncbi:MAG: ribosome assembly cofactor RimP [Flavobacteriales bacterium]|nr:MAG: ribosome assembly cofactor RimP [Flavobacteriales bacterium]
MIDIRQVTELCETALADFDGFVVDISVDAANAITILVDTDEGITIDQLKSVSRSVESGLDRESEDFMLMVSSPGVARPLDSMRMYRKNIGRDVKVKIIDGETLRGKLIEVQAEAFVIQWSEREPKPIGKGKVTVEKTQTIRYDQVRETKIQVSL